MIIIMSRFYGTCQYRQTKYWTSPYRLGSRPTGGYMTTTPSHHSVVHQNCLLNGQVIGMSRGFRGRKFAKRRGIIVTHLTLVLRGRLLQCFKVVFLTYRAKLLNTDWFRRRANLKSMGHTTQLRGMASTLRMRTPISPEQWQPALCLAKPC